MHDSQLAANDACFYYLARSGRSTDWTMWWVFDGAAGTPPTAADLVAYLEERAEALQPLRRRVRDVPGGFGHPFWVVDDSPLDSHLTVHAEHLDWAGLLERMGDILAHPLDARINAWQLHVFADVSDSESHPVVVVMIHVSHALMAGPAMTALSETLFGPAAQPLRIDGLGPATPRPPVATTAIRGVLSTPWRLLRFWSGLRAENRRIARTGDDGGPSLTPRTATPFNRRIGPGRAVRTFTIDLPSVRTPGITVTATGLTAISQALQRYLDKRGDGCPEDLAAFVTIAVPDVPVMGVNQVGADVVDLHPGQDDPARRALAVDATLRLRRGSATSERELNRLHLVDRLPSRVYRTAYGTLRPPETALPAVAHTILTSIRCEPTVEWTLLDRPFRSAAMLPPVYPDIALAHSFVGVGDSFTVSVAADPEIVPDLDDYLDMLRESLEQSATTPGGTAV
ncbi:hypothetical protein BJY24_006986 [Nocardia transvalensis]|uniref:Diacylglycerol O-acyltransferase n=1 Tax=Nocardia transvalensis TaxID=37333 RepID=A0A7W9PM07_9NOCA|nr:wax ester/triacylglycerol synthase domain-containing protein [Nocardia transvalensis]MBB5918074.1 hypothetical protein [Nocardia transvalensis]